MGIEILDAPAEIEQFQRDRPITNLMLLIWQNGEDLQKSFDLNTKAGQEAFISWYDISVNTAHRMKGLNLWLSRASQWLPGIVRNKLRHTWYLLIAKGARIKSEGTICQEKLGETKLGQTECIGYGGNPGVNLIGYAHAELGLGEHVRKTAEALSETDVPFGVVDFSSGILSRKKASLDHGSLINSNIFKVNLFHVNADRMLPAYSHLGRKFFERRYNIGYPFWELSRFPQEWILPMQMLDEVWAPTTYIQKALIDALGQDVMHMPVGVSLPKIPKLGREHFGIPADRYLFFFAFDYYSFIDRKNPYAVVEAFKNAFPLGNEKAGLIIKVMNAQESCEKWQRLVYEIGGDGRISLINETMDKIELLSYMSECDCYISLHRSEGLGLGPLEAMLLGKPVIITNYSGNTDYAKPDNSCLVDYTLIPVQEGQYLFHENQVWADPDIEHAASHMQRLANDPEFGISLGKKAAAFVSNNFSPAHCGQLYKQRLRALGML